MIEQAVKRIAQLIHPLVDSYKLGHCAAPDVEEVQPEEVPEPFHELLVHSNDMTPTLERFHGQSIDLHVLCRRVRGDVMLRQVVLLLAESRLPVEFGAIDIHLDRFAPDPRREIEECRRPLGTLLAMYAVEHHKRPAAFLRVMPDKLILDALGLPVAEPLYGRCNTIYAPDNRPMAEIVELIPPIPTNGLEKP